MAFQPKRYAEEARRKEGLLGKGRLVKYGSDGLQGYSLWNNRVTPGHGMEMCGLPDMLHDTSVDSEVKFSSSLN